MYIFFFLLNSREEGGLSLWQWFVPVKWEKNLSKYCMPKKILWGKMLYPLKRTFLPLSEDVRTQVCQNQSRGGWETLRDWEKRAEICCCSLFSPTSEALNVHFHDKMKLKMFLWVILCCIPWRHHGRVLQRLCTDHYTKFHDPITESTLSSRSSKMAENYTRGLTNSILWNPLGLKLECNHRKVIKIIYYHPQLWKCCN